MIKKSLINQLAVVNTALGVVTLLNCILYVHADREPQPNHYDDITIPTKQSGHSGNTQSSNEPSIPFASDLGFIHAFVASLSVILVSELGDKTFFIAAIMAMRHARLIVFAGAISALALMTILSAVFGMAATIIPRVYTYYISTALFAIFGLKMLRDGYYMSPTDAQEELEEVQSDLKKRDDELQKSLKESPSKLAIIEPTSSLSSNHQRHHHHHHHHHSLHNDSSSSNNSNSTNNNQLIAVHHHNDSKHKRFSMGGDDDDDETDDDTGTQKKISTPTSASVGLLRTNINNSNATLKSGGGSTTSLGGTKIGNVSSSDGIAIEMKQLNKTNAAKNRFEKETMTSLIQDPESGLIQKRKAKSAGYITSRILMQAFTMTFLAEWGDRSQLTTIILGAREDVYGVIVGGILGHSLCTGLAVIGGRIIAQRISVRTVTLVGGVVFLLFAVSALFISPNEETPNIDTKP